MFQQLISDLESLKDPAHAVGVSRFFKTWKGEYGEGDIFLWINVPQIRKLSKKYKGLKLSDIQTLITSPLHEYRLLAVFILTIQYERSIKTSKNWWPLLDKASVPFMGREERGGLNNPYVIFYLEYKAHINNRDLVDLSAPNILWRSILEAIIANEHHGSTGDPAKILHTLSHSASLRDRRISIISTFTLLKAGFYDDTLIIAETLLHDKHDLIHKAVGRMLREIGKRCKSVEDEFLLKHYKHMPRTMLRYAIEKYPEDERLKWLRGEM